MLSVLLAPTWQACVVGLLGAGLDHWEAAGRVPALGSSAQSRDGDTHAGKCHSRCPPEGWASCTTCWLQRRCQARRGEGITAAFQPTLLPQLREAPATLTSLFRVKIPGCGEAWQVFKK